MFSNSRTRLLLLVASVTTRLTGSRSCSLGQWQIDLSLNLRPMSDLLLHIFHCGKVYSYSSTKQQTSSYFGGPIPGRLTGIPHGPALPHHVAKLDLSSLNGQSEPSDVVLIYGFRFSGCEMEYELTSGSEIKITASCQRKSSDDWPYPDYPREFPKIFLELTSTREVSYEEWSYEWPNLTGRQPPRLSCWCLRHRP